MNKHLGYCVTVGKGNMAYVMDGRIFEKRKDAIVYRSKQVKPAWYKDWHITKVGQVK